MAKLSTVINKLKKIGVSVEAPTGKVHSFYFFKIGLADYRFFITARNDQVSCLCQFYGNGTSASYYDNITQLIKISSYVQPK